MAGCDEENEKRRALDSWAYSSKNCGLKDSCVLEESR